MAVEKMKILNFEVEIQEIPESLKEATERFGEQVVLQGFVKQTLYHSLLAEIRASVVEALEEHTGIKRASEPARPQKEGESAEDVPAKYTETPLEYVERLVGENGFSVENLQEIIPSQFLFDATPTVRERKPKTIRPDKQAIATASAAFARGTEYVSKFSAFLAEKLGEKVDSSSIESLAIGVKKYTKMLEEEAKKKLEASMADIKL